MGIQISSIPGADTPGDTDTEVEASTPDYGSISFEAGGDTWVVVEATDDCVTFNVAADGK